MLEQKRIETQKNSTYIEVNDLGHESCNHEYQKHVNEPLIKLRRSSNLRHYCSAKYWLEIPPLTLLFSMVKDLPQALRRNNAQTPNKTAYAQIHKHALLSISGTSPERNECTSHNNDPGVSKEARRYDIILHLLYIRSRGLCRRIQNNDDGPYDAIETPNLSHEAQPFFQENRAQYGCDDHTQGAQWSDQNCVHKSIRYKVADLSDDHKCHTRPPPRVLEITIAIAGLFMVFHISFEQAHFLEDEGYADEDSRADRENDPYNVVYGRSAGRRRTGTCSGICSSCSGASGTDCDIHDWGQIASTIKGYCMQASSGRALSAICWPGAE